MLKARQYINQFFGQVGEVLVVDILAYFVVQALAQFKQMVARRAETQHPAAGSQQARRFLPVDRAEHAGQQLA